MPAIKTLGLAAAGSAGKASAPVGAGVCVELAGVDEDERLGALGRARAGEGAAAAHGVAEAAGRREDDGPPAAERGGKGFEDEEVDGIAPLLPTAEREDRAVEDFNLRTREPPVFTVLGDIPGNNPPGPGKAG